MRSGNKFTLSGLRICCCQAGRSPRGISSAKGKIKPIQLTRSNFAGVYLSVFSNTFCRSVDVDVVLFGILSEGGTGEQSGFFPPKHRSVAPEHVPPQPPGLLTAFVCTCTRFLNPSRTSKRTVHCYVPINYSILGLERMDKPFLLFIRRFFLFHPNSLRTPDAFFPTHTYFLASSSILI